MENVFYLPWEPELIIALQARLGTFAAEFAKALSVFGEELVLIGILGFVYWCLDKELGKRIGLIMVVGNVLFPMIKNVALRPRPYIVHREIRCLKPVNTNADPYDLKAQGWSFPSGHAQNSVALYGSLGMNLENRAMKAVCFSLPVLVGLSRVAVGVHYPTDVMAGWLLGAGLVVLIPKLDAMIGSRAKLNILLAIFGAAGFLYCRTDDYYTSYGLLLGYFLAVSFEERFVRFENTNDPLACVLRMIFGIGCYLGLNTLLKLPFSPDFLSSATTAAFAVRALRYTFVTFVSIGVYPLLFSRVKILQ